MIYLNVVPPLGGAPKVYVAFHFTFSFLLSSQEPLPSLLCLSLVQASTEDLLIAGCPPSVIFHVAAPGNYKAGPHLRTLAQVIAMVGMQTFDPKSLGSLTCTRSCQSKAGRYLNKHGS